MIFGLLGPLLWPGSALGDSGSNISAAKHRSVLAILLINANRSVRVEQIINELWSEHAPDSAENLVRQYVSQLRRRLRGTLRKAGHDGHLIETAPAGYVLHLRPGDLDRDVFEARVGEAHTAVGAGNPAAAQVLLDEAIGLWRGPFLTDVPASPVIVGEASRLEERKFGAQELQLKVRLASGQFTELLSEVSGLITAHPRRESLRQLEMRALYAAGRRADALAVYQRLRTELVDELGIEPGPQLNAIHSAILDDDVQVLQLPPSAIGLRDPVAGATVQVIPAQLPISPPDLVLDDTRHDLETTVAQSAGQPGADPLTVVSGMTGTGKTALVVHLGHRCRQEYPDGQLFVPLHGSSGSPMDPAHALRRILWALSGSADQLPYGLDAAADLYRSYLAERRALVILDDALDEAQVRPLLPGGGSNRVIVTSCRPLAGLEGARHVHLGALSAAHGLRLLGRIAGQDRVRREPAAAAEIVERCGRLPLAIRIAGGLLISHPHLTISQLAGRLAGENILVKLSVGGLSLRDRLAAHWRTLHPDLQRVLRQAGEMPASGFSSAMVASGIGAESGHQASPRELEEAGEALEQLAEANLLDVITGADEAEEAHYRLSDLMRAFIAEAGTEASSASSHTSQPGTASAAPAERAARRLHLPRRFHRHGVRLPSGSLVIPVQRGCCG